MGNPNSTPLLLNVPVFFTTASVLALFVLVTYLYRCPSTEIFLFSSGPLVVFTNSSAASLTTTAASHNTTHLASPPPESKPSNVSLEKGVGRVAAGASDGDEDLASCDLFDGRWVVDDSSPSYRPGSCPFIDQAFNCVKNGRKDLNYTKLRWQPKGCQIPRLDGRRMLEMLRGKRLAFVGDSLNRNMWESLVCILRNSLPNKRRVYEVSGRMEFKRDGFYSFRFMDYNCTIEFFRSPFLVREWEKLDSNKTRKETLRLDLIDGPSDGYKDADVIVFNTAHWWTHTKTSQGKDYYQEGNHVYSQLSQTEAYHKALSTWARWVDINIDPARTRIFFRGYSASHFNGGQWNDGGTCDGETLPIVDDKYLAKYPNLMHIVESVIEEMKAPVVYLNVTKMTDYRKDAHPSVFREPGANKRPGWFQDCSHWCLPGVPDAWNELLYAMLLRGSGLAVRQEVAQG